jgi:16S rRNA (uracil1498-N3)-methyltransferase
MGGPVSIPRLHSDAQLATGAEIALTPAQAHHLGVLRRGAGDAVQVFNERDGEWAAEIAALRKDKGSLRLTGRLRQPAAEPGPTLIVAALKRDPMDWLVEKATELGVSRIQPVITRRTVASHANTERLAAIARAAAEQCERLSIPVVNDTMPLHAVLDAWQGGRILVAAERRDSASLASLTQGAEALLIGPEGGFMAAELDDLARRPIVSLCRLGPRILRAETAAVAGLAALQALAGDWAGQ